jgi:hypothetical protein
MYQKIDKCRICGNSNLVSVLDLGEQYLTGVFPKTKDIQLTKGPLELVKCIPRGDDMVCGLVQLRHSYNLEEMYGDTYGYSSALNQSMVKHLKDKVDQIVKLIELKKGDIVIDIGSNDATLLKAYSNKDIVLYGVDPSAIKFKEQYIDNRTLISEFFPSTSLIEVLQNKKAKVVTCIAMFYDLEDPVAFSKAIYDLLDIDGVVVFEQSYLPRMLAMNSYDTVCHEHLEYYTMKQIKWIMDKVGFKVIDISFNAVNGGSFSITVAKNESSVFKECTELLDQVLEKEKQEGYDNLDVYKTFNAFVQNHKIELINLLTKLKSEGKRVLGYGASTKGNVVLQYCSITPDLLPCIIEVNKDKFGAYTPGTLIPIVSELEGKAMNPDFLFVLPWHFKDNFIEREKEYLSSGGALIFPLPYIQIVEK